MKKEHEPVSYRIVEQEDGGFAVHVLSRDNRKIVPGFPTSHQAQQWIDHELGNRPND